MPFKCDFCDEIHNEIPMDIAYRFPPSVLEIPPLERVLRAQLTADTCVIDDSVFIIRGVFEFPVLEMDDNFRWGAWVMVDRWSYQRYVQIFNVRDVSQEPAMIGKLDGDLRDFPRSTNLSVKIQLQNDGLRPRFLPIDKKHPVAIAQSQGITMNDAHHFVRDLLARAKKK